MPVYMSREEYMKVFETYVEELGEGRPFDAVLKTDLWNESKANLPDRGGILAHVNAKSLFGIDIDHAVVETAVRIWPSVWREMDGGGGWAQPSAEFLEGDIRDLCFADNWFDLILDLSTIDHIPLVDVPKTLDEYERVLVRGGTLYLSTWLVDRDHEVNDPIDGSELRQYCFPRNLFAPILESRFNLQDVRVLWTGPEDRAFVRFVATARGSE